MFNVIALTNCLLQIMTTDQIPPFFHCFNDVDSNTDGLLSEYFSDFGHSRLVQKSGWVYRVFFPNAGFHEFSFLTTFLLHYMTTFEELLNCDLYLQEISDVLSTSGASVANTLLVDFRDAGIYPPTFISDLRLKLHHFPHELIYQTYVTHEGPIRCRFLCRSF